MADRFYGYQYDTNPRKLKSDYDMYNKRYSSNNEPVKTTNNNYNNIRNKKQNEGKGSHVNKGKKHGVYGKNGLNENKQVVNKVNKVRKGRHSFENNNENMSDVDVQYDKVTKSNVKPKMRIIVFLLAGFSVLFAISYQNSLINESFNRKEQLKKEMEALSKTNQQMEVNIENGLNLNTIEEIAKDKIGMQKLSNDQKIYVSLPKQDYVAPASEQVVIVGNQSFLQKIISFFVK